ncbi:MAG: CpaF family protein [Gammaproteobacteria bacterium]
MPQSHTTQALTILGHLLAPLRPWFEDESVEEIMVNRPDEIWIECHGRFKRAGVELSPLSIRSAITVLGRMVGKDVGTSGGSSCYLDARLDGMRVTAVRQPVSIRSDVLALRKPNRSRANLEALCASLPRTRTEPTGCAAPTNSHRSWAKWFREKVRDRRNFLISGGTSSGKTTFLNGLLTGLITDDRVITIEDTPELDVPTSNWVALESRDQSEHDARALVRLALRLRPDRLLIGEVRGREAFDLLQACNTGHRGTLTSLHANSARDALYRLETLVLMAGVAWPHDAIRRQIASAFDYVVHLERRGGQRRLVEVLEIIPDAGSDYHLAPVCGIDSGEPDPGASAIAAVFPNQPEVS